MLTRDVAALINDKSDRAHSIGEVIVRCSLSVVLGDSGVCPKIVRPSFAGCIEHGDDLAETTDRGSLHALGRRSVWHAARKSTDGQVDRRFGAMGGGDHEED